jgi:hypothetical protein
VAVLASICVDATKKLLAAKWMKERFQKQSQIHPNSVSAAPTSIEYHTNTNTNSNNTTERLKDEPRAESVSVDSERKHDEPKNPQPLRSSVHSSRLTLITPPDIVMNIPEAGKEFEINQVAKEAQRSIANLFGRASVGSRESISSHTVQYQQHKQHLAPFYTSNGNNYSNSHGNINNKEKNDEEIMKVIVDPLPPAKTQQPLGILPSISTGKILSTSDYRLDMEGTTEELSKAQSKVIFTQDPNKKADTQDEGEMPLDIDETEDDGVSRQTTQTINNIMDKMTRSLRLSMPSADSLIIHRLNEGLDHYQDMKKTQVTSQVSGMLQRAITTSPSVSCNA